MKIMVTGIGGVGGYIASVLCANYTDITLIARKAHKDALIKNGLIVYSDFFGDHTAYPAITDTPSDAGIQDMIFVCVKNYSLKEALTALIPCIDEHTIVVLILNGVDHYDVAKQILPPCRIVDAAIYITSSCDAAYVIHQEGRFTRIILGGPDTEAVRTAHEILDHPGITCRIAADIHVEQWNKYVLNCAYNVMTAYYACPISDIMDNDARKQEFYTLLREACAVGKALGIGLADDLADTVFARILHQEKKDTTSSLARDVMAGRQSELETFSGYLVRTARQLGIPVPVSAKRYETLLQRTSKQ